MGGSMMPPEIVQAMAASAPSFIDVHALDATRDVMEHDLWFQRIAVDLYSVLGYTLGFFALGVCLFRRKMAG
jgi:hypothetical protein